MTDSATWYKNQPVGKVTFMKSMAECAGLKGRKTNHSARKTMISRLVEKNINPLHVAQLSGHKNLKSLDSYSNALCDDIWLKMFKFHHLLSSLEAQMYHWSLLWNKTAGLLYH